MLHRVNKKRLAQAIEAYTEYNDMFENPAITSHQRDEQWKKFYHRARFCCDGTMSLRIPPLIYGCNPKRLSVENIYHAILILGLNEDCQQTYDDAIGEEYYD